MGAAQELQAMAERQELEAIEPSPAKASALIADARRSLATCRSIAEKDPKSALLVAWDGIAFPSLTAALALAGYRVTSRMGHQPPDIVELTEALDDCEQLIKVVARAVQRARTS